MHSRLVAEWLTPSDRRPLVAADVRVMKMRYSILVLSTIACCATVGCRGLRDPHARMDRLESKLTDQRVDQLSATDFPPPEHTPFDATNSLRQACLSGYTNGVAFALSVRGECGTHTMGWQTQEDLARIYGWKSGRNDVCKRIRRIESQVEAEVWQRCLNKPHPFLTLDGETRTSASTPTNQPVLRTD